MNEKVHAINFYFDLFVNLIETYHTKTTSFFGLIKSNQSCINAAPLRSHLNLVICYKRVEMRFASFL